MPILLGAGVLLVCLAALAWPAPVWLRVCLVLGAAVYTITAVIRHRRHGAMSIRVGSSGACSVQRGRGDALAGSLDPTWFASPWLICLGVRPHGRGRVRRIAVFRDAVSTEDFRRLAARLRYPA